MAKKRTMNEYRQTKDVFYKVPTHDPQTGELNPHYKDLTGRKNPWALCGPPNIGSEGEVRTELGNDYTEPTLYKQLLDLRKKYPNDQEFGYHVAKELL